jgi:hypothetical protein
MPARLRLGGQNPCLARPQLFDELLLREQVLRPRAGPDEAGEGNAKVKLSFPDWTEGQVSPASFEVPVLGPPVRDGDRCVEERLTLRYAAPAVKRRIPRNLALFTAKGRKENS